MASLLFVSSLNDQYFFYSSPWINRPFFFLSLNVQSRFIAVLEWPTSCLWSLQWLVSFGPALECLTCLFLVLPLNYQFFFFFRCLNGMCLFFLSLDDQSLLLPVLEWLRYFIVCSVTAMQKQRLLFFLSFNEQTLCPSSLWMTSLFFFLSWIASLFFKMPLNDLSLSLRAPDRPVFIFSCPWIDYPFSSCPWIPSLWL
jgi:hypothetical protein